MLKAMVVMVLMTGWIGAATQAPAVEDPNLAAAQRWVGRGLILRGFYGVNELKFDANGKVEGAPKTVDWTLAGVDLEGVKRVDAETIELDGVRVAIRYNPDNLLFDRHPQKDQRVKVLVAVRKVGSSANTLLGMEPVEETLGEIFAMGIDPALQRSMPDYWKHYFDPNLAWGGDGLDGQTVYPGKGAPGAPAGLTYPEVERKTPSSETAEAEKDKVRGSVSVRLVVDPAGEPKRVAILKPLGYGLDARAAQDVKAWKFTPGQLGGKAVAVRMDVNDDFAPTPPAKK
jgi:TonB family protein